MFEPLWETQLKREYENIMYQYSVRLKRASICVGNNDSEWGKWEPLSRTITISRRLIEEHSWDTVIEVLKHEIAHQLVTEYYHAEDRPHGEVFQEACRKLGLSGWACHATGALPKTIPDWKKRLLTKAEKKLVDRVEKLLALASATPNEHEAGLAMQRVQEMYTKYNLAQIQTKQQPKMVYAILGEGKKRMDVTDSWIAWILETHFFVRVIFESQYDAEETKSFRVLEVLGTPENVAMAEYVYRFLKRQINSLWKEYQERTQTVGRLRRSFQVGLLSGFSDKLELQKAENGIQGRTTPGQAKALVRLHDQSLEKYLHYRHPRLVNRKGGGTQTDPRTYHAGVEQGHSMNLYRAVAERQGNRGGVLPTGG